MRARVTTIACLAAVASTLLLMRLHVVSSVPDSLRGVLNGAVLTDLFFAKKALACLIFAAVALVGILFSAEQRNAVRGSPQLPAALALMLAVLASAALSDYPELAWTGSPTPFEGAPLIIGYLVLFLAATVGFATPKTRALLTGTIMVTLVAVAALGAFELAGKAPVAWPPLKRLILGDHADVMQLTTADTRQIVATLGNPNHVGSYAALVWPFLAALALSSPGIGSRALLGLAAGVAFFVLLGSGSRGAFVACSAAFVVILALEWRQILRRPMTLTLLAGLHCALVPAVDRWSSGILVQKADSIFDKELVLLKQGGAKFVEAQAQNLQESISAGWPAKTAAAEHSDAPASPPPLRDESRQIFVRNGRLHFSMFGATLILERARDGVRLMDGTFRPLMTKQVGDTTRIVENPAYDGFEIRGWLLGKVPMLTIKVASQTQDIALTPRGFRVLQRNALLRPEVAERAPLPLADEFLSGRGYIWSRTLPLLAHTWLLGRGPGSFVVDFPNRDIGGIGLAFGDRNLYVDRPHNMYMQFAHANGNLALGLLLALMVAYVRRQVKDPARTPFATACFAAFVGYAIVGLVNDSLVAFAPLFWVLWGAGWGQRPGGRSAGEAQETTGPAASGSAAHQVA